MWPKSNSNVLVSLGGKKKHLNFHKCDNWKVLIWKGQIEGVLMWNFQGWIFIQNDSKAKATPTEFCSNVPFSLKSNVWYLRYQNYKIKKALVPIIFIIYINGCSQIVPTKIEANPIDLFSIINVLGIKFLYIFCFYYYYYYFVICILVPHC